MPYNLGDGVFDLYLKEILLVIGRDQKKVSGTAARRQLSPGQIQEFTTAFNQIRTYAGTKEIVGDLSSLTK